MFVLLESQAPFVEEGSTKTMRRTSPAQLGVNTSVWLMVALAVYWEFQVAAAPLVLHSSAEAVVAGMRFPARLIPLPQAGAPAAREWASKSAITFLACISTVRWRRGPSMT